MTYCTRFFPNAGKSSNVKSNADLLSQNKGFIRSIGDEEAMFRCGSCIAGQQFYFAENVDRRRISFDTLFGSEQILSRKPRLVRGLYLGKEPLEYQKTATPFRFSFQKPSKDATADKENDKVKAFARKIIYPKSMTVGGCSLQSRPEKFGQLKQDRAERKNALRACSNAAGHVSATLRGLITSNVPTPHQHSNKEVPLLSGKETKPKINLKRAEKVKLKGRMSLGKFQEKSAVKIAKKARVSRSDYFKRKKEDCLNGKETNQDKSLMNYTGNIPAEFYGEYFTFKLSDYDIWSRISKTC